MIRQLREQMKQENISVYVIPTCDFHDSEYVGEHFAVRKAFSGFTGSAGTLVITPDDAALFTDGRYFVQAERQLRGTGIQLMKMGEPGVPDINDYIKNQVKEGTNIGIDGRVVSFDLGQMLMKMAKEKGGCLLSDADLAGEIWKERPSMEFHKLFRLPLLYTGEETADKLKRVRKAMEEFGTDTLLLATLDDIAWLFNIRGTDVPSNPIVFAYACIEKNHAVLYLDKAAYDAEDVNAFAANAVELRPYTQIYEDVLHLENHVILTDVKRTNYELVKRAGTHNKVIHATSPTTLMKAVKNKVEIDNTRKIHLADGAAVTKFMYWLKTKACTDGSEHSVTEQEAADYLDHLRSQIDGYLDLSFDTISAYGANAAMMHYNAKTGNNCHLKEGNMLLVDSGGQYYNGTTDITRTFAIGTLTRQMKKHFTTVAVSMLRLMNLQFLYGCCGCNLDIIARQPLWALGLDYKCGTGHGVGHILNVHEGPNVFRWKVRNTSSLIPVEAGMITTDEPGVYLEGEYGIRTENELLCEERFRNQDGIFMGFSCLTFAPIDLDAIDPDVMEPQDKAYLNAYHKQVYENISPYLDEKEREWLKEYTRGI